jgi:elongation factor Ts
MIKNRRKARKMPKKAAKNKIDLKQVKELRDLTGQGVLEVKEALEKADGDYEKAKKELLELSAKKASKKADRDASDGLVYSYIHTGGKVGSLVLVACETDFVAKTDDFKNLCHNLAMQVCTGEYETVDEVLADEFIKDPSKKVSELVTETVGKLGEKMELLEFVRFSVR